jgi:hypothetical protein
MISLGGGGLPRGEYDRFQIATPPFGVGGSARLPLGESDDLPRGGRDSPCGEYIGLPRGGRTPTVGVTFSPVGKRPPLGGWDVSPIGGETPSG